MKDLVCLHAGSSGPTTWARFVPEFEAMGYRVHCPTLLGHGSAERRRSYRLDDFRDQLLKELDHLGTMTLIGNSLGAFVASSIAVAEPDRIERLVLEELPVPPLSTSDSGPSAKTIPGAVWRIAGWLNRRKCDPRLLLDVITDLRRPQPQWWTGLSAVKAPTLLLAGGPKSHLDQSRFDLVASTMPTATLKTIAIGHRIHTNAPDRWLATVQSFLRG